MLAQLIGIENKDDQLQYFNGAIYGGAGVYLEGGGGDNVQAIRFDLNTVDDLETMGGKGQSLTRTDYAISR